MRLKLISYVLLSTLLLWGCSDDDGPQPSLVLASLNIGNADILSDSLVDAPIDLPILASFNTSLDTASVTAGVSLIDEENNAVSIEISFFNRNKAFSVRPEEPLGHFTTYSISLSNDIMSDDGKQTFPGAELRFRTVKGTLVLESVTANGVDLTSGGRISNVPVDLQIRAQFSSALDPQSVSTDHVILHTKGKSAGLGLTIDDNILIVDAEDVEYYSLYDLELHPSIRGISSDGFEGLEVEFYTGLDSTLKFPEISDDELLTLVQEQTFKYFWDFGHPVSGLARERNTSGETVTIGGSGFGVMAIIVGIEREFITREEGVDRLLTIVTFLLTQADRFHGVWSHWLNGTTGNVRPFSADDDGGDLVETAFMIQGLLTARQYLDDQNALESEIISKINQLWHAVEWDWYTQEDQNVLYWHWSPNFGWQKNHRISGWNEALIVYVLAASSPTHTIERSVYTSGWARSGAMRNGNTYYDIALPLGPSRGGPLFFSHYSFLGLDPRNLEDQYANYWEQNVNHSRINYEYSVLNPRDYISYGEGCWGLTASDNHEGYSAHSPTNDKGVITPTAAISSIPYTPEESMAAIRHFYYYMGDRIWGNYGFRDAFNATEDWYASSYLAIDQGPIICMIENHRTGLLWDLFMSAPEIQEGLTKLEISYE